MPTDRPRITITMSDEQLERVRDYQFGNKMKNQTQAILSLLEKGMEEIERAASTENKNTLTPAEADARAENLSTEEKIRLSLTRLGLIDENAPLSDADRSFLEHIFLAVEAYFEKQ